MKIPSLSEAIALGYPEIEHSNAMFLVEDKPGQCRGCAIGAALYAMGERNMGIIPTEALAKYWPWTRNHPDLHLQISNLFQDVMYEEITIEQLIDWVKWVERWVKWVEPKGEKHEDESQGLREGECGAVGINNDTGA